MRARSVRLSRSGHRKSLVLLAILPLVGLAACGDNDEPQETKSDGETSSVCTEDRVDADSTLTVDTWVPTPTLDPIMAGGVLRGAEETSVLYDTLTRYDSETGEYVPYLAESVSANEDATEWTVKLRSGVTFGNGDPLTANDVKYSLDRMMSDTATTATKNYLEPVTDVEVVDDLTAVVTLNRSWGTFPWILSDLPGMIVNQKVVEAAGDGFATNPKGAGVGPYEFVSFTPNEELVMQAKTDYWNGPVCIGKLRFVSIPGTQTQLDALEKGEIDVATIENDATVSKAIDELDNATGLHYERAGIGFGMNMREGKVFEDQRLRQAVVAALDPDLINQRAFNGDARMERTLTASDMKIYGNVEGLEFDPEHAKELVSEAAADGVDPSIDFLVNDTTNPDLVLTVEALLKEAGFTVNTETVSYSAFLERYFSRDFDLMPANTGTGEDAPIRTTPLIDGASAGNVWGVNDEGVNDAINDLYLAKTTDESAAAMGELQERWNELAPTAPLWVQDITKGISDKVIGLEWGPEGRLSFERAYITS